MFRKLMPDTEWTKQNSTSARQQGWNVFEIWDGRRLIYEIQAADDVPIMHADEAARAFVKARTDSDALCHKAWSLVFNSKLIQPPKGKKK